MIAVLSDYNDIDTIKSSLIDHKIIGFKEVYLDMNQQKEIVAKLLTDDELVENNGQHNTQVGFHLAMIENVEKIVDEEALNRHDPIGFMHGNWHQDNPDEKYIPSYVSMSMTKYLCSEKGVGETVFIDLEKAFLDCPEDIKHYLDGIDVRHISPNTQPDGRISSPYRINPETGNICLYYSSDNITPVDGMTTEFQSYLDWFRAYRESNLTEGDVYLTWEWDEGDLVIWDNRNILHSVTGGWKIGDRIFNKINAKMEEPINGRRPRMKINFGAGPRHRPDGWIAADIIEGIKPDVLLVENSPFPWDDDSVDQIYSSHVFEHIWLDDMYGVLAEMHRVTRHGGQILTITPDIKSLVESFVNRNEDGMFGHGGKTFTEQDWFANPEITKWNPNKEWNISLVLAQLFSELVLEDDRIQRESRVFEALPHGEHKWNTYGSRLLKVIRSVFPNSILLGTNGIPPEIWKQGREVGILNKPFEFVWTDPDSGFVWPTVNWFVNTCAVLSTVEKEEFT